jgi:hypothetical protein
LDIEGGMLTVKMRNDEVKGRRDEERFFADIERILKANQILARHLNRKNIDRPELWVVHIANGTPQAKPVVPCPMTMWGDIPVTRWRIPPPD